MMFLSFELSPEMKSCVVHVAFGGNNCRPALQAHSMDHRALAAVAAAGAVAEAMDLRT